METGFICNYSVPLKIDERRRMGLSPCEPTSVDFQGGGGALHLECGILNKYIYFNI